MKPIQPIQYVMNLPEANTLDVIIVGDNLTSMCQLSWTLYNVTITPAVTHIDEITGDTITDSNEVTTTVAITNGNAVIAGDNYKNWDGNNTYPWTYTAQQIGVTLI